MLKTSANSFWRRAAKALPSQLHRRYATDFAQAERMEIVLATLLGMFGLRRQ